MLVRIACVCVCVVVNPVRLVIRKVTRFARVVAFHFHLSLSGCRKRESFLVSGRAGFIGRPAGRWLVGNEGRRVKSSR